MATKCEPRLMCPPKNARSWEAGFVRNAARLTLDDPAMTNKEIARVLGAHSYTADSAEPCEFVGFLPGVVEGSDFMAFRRGRYLYVIQTPPSPVELARGTLAKGPKYGPDI